MLYLIGLGICDENDLSLKALDAIKTCDKVFCEFYTNKWHGPLAKLKKIAGKNIEVLTRDKIEGDFLVNEAERKNVALLVPGDPFTATTHMELFIECKKRNIPVEIIHSSSIYTAVAECGLQLYKFGRATTIAFSEGDYKPASIYDAIHANKKSGLHTLVLLDTKDGEHYMTIKEGLEILLDIEKGKKENLLKNSKIIACCALGSKNQLIKYADISYFIKNDIKETPATIIVPGRLHFKEEEALELWKQTNS